MQSTSFIMSYLSVCLDETVEPLSSWEHWMPAQDCFFTSKILGEIPMWSLIARVSDLCGVGNTGNFNYYPGIFWK